MKTQTTETESVSRRNGRPPLTLAVFVLFAWLLFGASSSAVDSDNTKRVLVLYSFRYGIPGNELADANDVVGQGIRSTFEEGTKRRVAFFSERMDESGPLSEKRYFEQLRDVYAERYVGKKIDLIIAVNYRALEFLNKHGEEIWSKTPVVFCGVEVSRREQLKQMRLPMTGVLQDSGMKETLETILGIHPDTEQVVVIIGASEVATMLAERARQVCRKGSYGVESSALIGLEFNTLLDRVAHLPPRSVVLVVSLRQDSSGNRYPMNTVPLLSRTSNAPVYGIFDVEVGHGIVGGHVNSFRNQGIEAAKLGLRIFRGETPEEIPIKERSIHVNLFDWRQLQRWGISDNRLPRDSAILFKEESIWDRYKWYIIGVTSLCVFEAVIIFSLVLNWVKYRRTHSALRESGQQLRLITDSLPVLIAQVDSQQCYVFGNAEYEKWFGVSGERLKGRLIREVIGEESYRQILPQIESALSGHREVFEIALPVSGEGPRHLHVNLVPNIAGNGDAIGYYVLASDITDLKQAEESLRQRREELARVTRIATMGELAASIAHEVNQPLCAIVSNAETAQRLFDAEPPDVDGVREILKDIVADGNRSTNVVSRIRALTRKETPRRRPQDVNQVIQEVLPLVTSDLAKRGISIELELADRPPLVEIGPVELQQVVVNLIVNAAQSIEEAPDSSGIVVIHSSADDEDTVTVAVRDDGVGLDEEQKERIFDAFFTTRPGGMGMGLSINRTIIESLGGRLWATQNADRGTTFHFSLPTKQQSEAETNARTANGDLDE